MCTGEPGSAVHAVPPHGELDARHGEAAPVDQLIAPGFYA